MSLRHERVRELLKREIGELVRREFAIEDVGLISVNEVAMSSDLHSAVVYVGVIGTEEQRKHARTRLQKERKRLQGLLGHSVILKYTPALKFVLDDSVTHGNKVLAILDELDKTLPPDETPSEDY